MFKVISMFHPMPALPTLYILLVRSWRGPCLTIHYNTTHLLDKFQISRLRDKLAGLLYRGGALDINPPRARSVPYFTRESREQCSRAPASFSFDCSFL